MKDITAALRAAYQEFLRVWKRRAWIRKNRASAIDPFTN